MMILKVRRSERHFYMLSFIPCPLALEERGEAHVIIGRKRKN